MAVRPVFVIIIALLCIPDTAPTVERAQADDDRIDRGWTETILQADAMQLEAAIAELMERPGAELRSALPAVRQRILDPDSEIVVQIVDLLTELRDEEAIADLIPLVDDPNVKVARAGQEALAAIGGSNLGSNPEVWTRWHQDRIETDEAALATLAEQLADDGLEARERTLRQLRLLTSHRHAIGRVLGPIAASTSDPLAPSAADTLRDLGGIAALYHPSADQIAAAELIDPYSRLSRSTRRVVEDRDDPPPPTGITTSQIVTLSVAGGIILLMLLGAGWLCWKHPAKVRQVTGRVTKAAGDRTRRLAKNLKRITFSD